MTRRLVTALAAAVIFLAGLSLGLTVRAAEAPRSAPDSILRARLNPGAVDPERQELTGAPQGASGVSIVAGETSPGPGSTPGASAAPAPSARVAQRQRQRSEGPSSAGSSPAPSTKSVRQGRTGLASTYGPGWDGWIAWPAGPGWRLRVCGDGGCRTVTSNDAGPAPRMLRAGRVIDLDVPTFEAVCGIPWWPRGLCTVTVTVLGRG